MGVLDTGKGFSSRTAKVLYEVRLIDQQSCMTSEQFYQQFLTGELGDANDYVDWAGFYEMLQPQPVAG